MTQIIILFFLIELKSKFCPKDKRKNGKYFTKKNVSGLNCTYYFKTTPIIRASRRRINSKIKLKAFARKPFEKSNISNFGDGRKFCHICFDYANEYYEHMIGNDISTRSFQKNFKQLLQPWRLNYMVLALNESMKIFFGQIHSFSLFH